MWDLIILISVHCVRFTFIYFVTFGGYLGRSIYFALINDHFLIDSLKLVRRFKS